MKAHRVAWIGNGTAQTIAVPFAPDIVIAQVNDSFAFEDGGAVFSHRGMSDYTIRMIGEGYTDQAFAGAITGFGINSFSIGADGTVNTNGNKYVGIALKSEGDLVWGSYTGTAAIQTVNLSDATLLPEILYTFGDDDNTVNQCWFKLASMAATESAPLTTGVGSAGFIETNEVIALNTGSFDLGAGNDTGGGAGQSSSNRNGVTYYYMAIKAGGTHGQGSYAGDNTDGRIIATAFGKPAMIMMHWYATDGSTGMNYTAWKMPGIMTATPPGFCGDNQLDSSGEDCLLNGAFGPTGFTVDESLGDGNYGSAPPFAATYLWWGVAARQRGYATVF